MRNFFRTNIVGGGTLRLSMVAVTFAMLAGCGGSDGESVGSDQPLAALNISARYSVMPTGLKQTLTVMVEGENGDYEDVTADATLSSTDNEKLTINGNVLSALGAGTYTVTASVKGAEEATIPIEVIPATYQEIKILAPTSEAVVTMPVGFTAQYRAEALFKLDDDPSGYASAYFEVTDVADWGGTLSIDGGLIAASEVIENAEIIAGYTPAGTYAAENPASAALTVVDINKSTGLRISRAHKNDDFVVGYQTPLRAIYSYVDSDGISRDWDATLDVEWIFKCGGN